MNFKKALSVVCASLISLGSLGSGFALYEPSATAHAMGGALVGRAFDASANYINPATLTDLTNIQVTVGFVTEHPRGRVKVNELQSEVMDSGMFVLPHLQVAVPLPHGFAFGLGISPEYGLGTYYGDDWSMAWNCWDTTVQGIVINPNIAYKITDKWSIGAGIRWLHFDFEQKSRPNVCLPMDGGLLDLGYLDYRLKGDNGFRSVGWQIGTKYDILDNLSVGLVYKAPIDVDVDGKTGAVASNPDLGRLAAVYSNSADADLKLPQSVTFGVNWDATKRLHLGASVAWTEWSTFDTLMFNVKPNGKEVVLNWRNTWRGSIGLAYDFNYMFTGMVSYTYDMNSTGDSQQSIMLPPANRHILGAGILWHVYDNLDFMLSYSCVFMTPDGVMTATDDYGRRYDVETCWGYCHAGGFSVTFHF